MAKIDEYPFGKLTIQLHAVTTDPPAPHPHIAPNVPANFHILGVGAASDRSHVLIHVGKPLLGLLDRLLRRNLQPGFQITARW